MQHVRQNAVHHQVHVDLHRVLAVVRGEGRVVHVVHVRRRAHVHVCFALAGEPAMPGDGLHEVQGAVDPLAGVGVRRE